MFSQEGVSGCRSPLIAVMSETCYKEPVAAFYDSLAVDYDSMTDFVNRFAREKPIFETLLKKFPARNALDAGCGTGFHSVLMAKLGVDVTAVDVSGEMVRRAAEHAREAGVQMKTMRSAFENLRDVLDERFDLVISLGNTLAHILNEEHMVKVLQAFRSFLNADGHLLLQLMNYDKILREKKGVQNTKNTANKIFVRSYEYGEREISFSILTQQVSGEPSPKKLQTVSLYPWRHEELARLIQQAGFKSVELYGSLALQEFDAESSKDLVILAQVPN
ncbi:MAG: Methyltransferase type 11 [Bacteroidetes bacterium]|nr:Methyltransferase type 11 [Bacteroidota bacterium]